MTVRSSVEMLAAPAQRFDVLTELEELQTRIGSAEEKAARLDRALISNRRIGMAVGILMCRRQLTEERAVALLKTQSQHRNIKVRELVETVIFTGTL